MTFPARELSAGSANGMSVAVLQALAPVLVTARHLVPALLVNSWLTPDSTAQVPSQAPQFYFSLACSLLQPPLPAAFGLHIIQFSELHLSF